MGSSFAIVTTTHKRPRRMLRCLESVLSQTYTRWHYYIVIDDPTSNYGALEAHVQNVPAISCIRNTENKGKNASLNTVLDMLQKSSFDGYVVFLDDDDWLSPTALEDFNRALVRHTPPPSWLISNRVLFETGQSLTHNTANKTKLHYYTDLLLFKRLHGDTTHCIAFSSVRNSRFPRYVKNAEEWVFFAQVARTTPFLLHIEGTGTFSDGYDPTGLTQLRLRRRARVHRLGLLLKELVTYRVFNIYVVLYLCGRALRTLQP